MVRKVKFCMRKIKVQYVGWWDTFQPDSYTINQILKEHYDVVISDEPDYVFCSLYSKELLKYDCVRIFYTGENVTPDFNLFDYCIGFDELTFEDRYIRVPNYSINPKYEQDIQLLKRKHIKTDVENYERKFCGMVVSNGNANPMRDKIFDQISKYKLVDSGGRYRNNIGIPSGVADKLEFQKKYKFVLAIENTSFPGYTTEKLIGAFAAGGIPIYWGDPNVGRYFNERAFVNIMAYPSLEEAIETIERIDKNIEIYKAYLAEPALIEEDHFEKLQLNLEKFLIHIMEQPLEAARRRPTSIWPDIIEGTLEKAWSNENDSARLRSKLRSIIRR